MTQQLPPKEVDSLLYEDRLELAESELKVALLLANFSSAAYSTGRLHHATDARCKAEHTAPEQQLDWPLRNSRHGTRTELD